MSTFHTNGADDGYTKAIQQILEDGRIQGGKNYHRNYKSQVITKYLLLDRLATALDCVAGDQLLKPRVPFADAIHDRLQQILRGTSKWHDIGRSIQEHLTSMSNDELEPFAHPITRTLNEHEEAFRRNVGWLWGAHSSFLKSDVAVAEGNLQLMAFMVRWHAAVHTFIYLNYAWNSYIIFQNNTPFPAKVDGFFEEVTTYVPPNLAALSLMLSRLSCPANNEFLRLSTPATAALKGPNGSALFEGLKAAVDLAVHISPLTLLTPVAFKRWSMDRQRLIEVRNGMNCLRLHLLTSSHRSGPNALALSRLTYYRQKTNCGIPLSTWRWAQNVAQLSVLF